MKVSDFLNSLAEQLAGPLETLGFIKIDNGLFVRFKVGHEINVISIQKHNSESKVSVNFGVHYDFLPKLGSTELPSQYKVELPDCEIKIRLTPELSQKDYWWPTESIAINQIANLIEDRAENIFDRYNIAGDITAISPEDLETGVPNVLSGLTKVRASLILSRIHEINGQADKAVSFAQFGIKVAGMAVGPKKMLKEVLKRIKQS